LFLQSQAGLQKASELLDDVFTSFGMSINNTKTVAMVLNIEEPTESIVTLKNVELKNVILSEPVLTILWELL